MARNVCNDSRLASAFATLVCAWAVALVVLGLSTAPHSAAGLQHSAAISADAIR
jgi:hypothetical protein